MPKASPNKNEDNSPEPENNEPPVTEASEPPPEAGTETAIAEIAENGDAVLLPAMATGDAPDAETGDTTASAPEPLTPERALDIAIGAVVLAAETLGRTSRQLQENAPAIIATWEEKGRPVRESLVDFLRGGAATDEEATQTSPPSPDAEAPMTVDGGEAAPMLLTPPPSPLPPLPSLPRPFFGRRPSGPAAEAEMNALEQRVRELEQQVSSPAETTPSTPAEEATFVPEPPSSEVLADSPYAISETAEEAERESHETGE